MWFKIAPYAVAALLLFGVVILKGEVDNLKTQKRMLEQSNSQLAQTIAVYESSTRDTDSIGKALAQACASSVQVRVIQTRQAQEIRNAPDPDTAARTYDRLLCERPEAAGHPACSPAEVRG